MGCLFEFFFEVFIEGILNVVMHIYLKLSYIFIPQKEISKKTKNKIRDIITTISVFLFLSLFIGVIFLLSPDAIINIIGKYLTFIPLSIIGMQIILGIIVTVVKAVKHQKCKSEKENQENK